jgi:hypothetical protein
MAFPQTVLPARVRIAPGGQPAADPATWAWTDITQWVRVASGIVIEAGRSDEGARVDPGKCTLTLDNRDGRFSTRNVTGPYFGSLAKGTPLRVGTICGAEAWAATTSNGWGTPDIGTSWSLDGSASDWSSSGGLGQVIMATAGTIHQAELVGADARDGEATFVCSVPVVATGAALACSLAVRRTAGVSQILLSVDFGTGGTLGVRIKRDVGGVPTDIGGFPSVGSYTAGQRIAVRCQWDGPALRIRVWPESSTEPTTWSATATDTQATGSAIALHSWRVIGNTNAGSLTFSWDDLEAEAIEFTGTVPEWPPRWDQSQRDATSTITAAGILRRLQQGRSPLKSPIGRMVLRQPGAIELWTFEDDSSATVAASAMPGGIPAAIRALDFAQTAPALAGAQQTAGITTSTVVTWKVRSHTATGTWGVVWYAQLLAKPAATTVIMSVNATGTVKRWDIILDSLNTNLLGYDSSGTQIYSAGAGYSALASPPMWIAFDLLVTQSGGNIDAKLLMYGVDPESHTAVFLANTVAGTVGSPTGGRFEGSLGYDGGRIGPLAVFNTEPSFVAGTFFDASNGYVGETASDRIDRLCTEEGVQVVIEDGTSEQLGPQRVGTFLDLLYAASDADLGVLYERGAGLAYRPRGARYNRPVELPLDFDAGDIAQPPEPTDDDQVLRNQWTISRDSGSSAVAQDDASIDAAGLIDESVTLNVASDGPLADHASWRLAMTTIDEYRWPSIVLDMARNTGQIRLWRAAEPFPRVTIANEPSQVAGNAVDVTVLGYRSTIMPKAWDLELVCAPSAPWNQAAVFDSSSYPATSASTTLGATATTTSSPLSLSTANPKDVWSTTVAPLTLDILGEHVTLLWMSGVGSIVALDGGFETGLTGWTAGGGSAVQSALFAHTGTHSAQLTVSGSPGTASLSNTTMVATTVGASYTATAWAYATGAVNNVRISISWYDSGSSFLSSSLGSTVNLTGGVWQKLTVTATAPAGAVKARYVPQIFSSPANGTIVYFDDADMVADATGVTSAGPYAQKAYVTRSANGAVLAHASGEAVTLHPPARAVI